MKKQILLFVFVILSVTGCKLIDKLTQFDMEFDETVEVPSYIGINLPFNILTPAIRTNSESTFEINDTRKDLIEEIILTSLDLTLTSPSDADFSFLKSVSIFISADGLSETEIAFKDDIPSDIGAVLTLETLDVDIQEYIKKDQFSLRLNTVTDEILTSDHQIDVHAVFFVDAKILGQ